MKHPFARTGVAIAITAVLIFTAIQIGQMRHRTQVSSPPPVSSSTPQTEEYYVYDDAQVLTTQGIQELQDRNQRLSQRYGAVIACVTCNYGKDDLGRYALSLGDDLGLHGQDFLVVLDIAGDNYWLIQGSDLVDEFTDEDCSNYAWEYLEKDFARKDYTSALLSLTSALEEWYHDTYR